MEKNITEQGVTYSTFAKILGVSQPTVSSYVATGIIPESCLIKVGKRKKIKPIEALTALSANLDPGQRKKRGREPASREYIKAKTEVEIYKAKEIKRRIDEKKARYISKIEVRRQITGGKAIIEKRVLALPKRLGAKLAKEEDEIKVLKIMDEEIRKCLFQIADELDKAE